MKNYITQMATYIPAAGCVFFYKILKNYFADSPINLIDDTSSFIF